MPGWPNLVRFPTAISYRLGANAGMSIGAVQKIRYETIMKQISNTVRKAAAALWYRTLYRPVMRLAHRFNWHYAPPMYPDDDALLRCSWCGLLGERRSWRAAATPFPTFPRRRTGRNPGDGQ
jgi:hypothetical protein